VLDQVVSLHAELTRAHLRAVHKGTSVDEARSLGDVFAGDSAPTLFLLNKVPFPAGLDAQCVPLTDPAHSVALPGSPRPASDP
jgi:hypothetical protein